MQDDQIKLVSGPVYLEPQKSLFERLQAIEFSSLIASGAATINLGLPTMANAANMAVSASIINDINAIVVVIAGAVEEQAVTTNQIAEDINSVSSGIEDMNQNVGSATDISTSVTTDINGVNDTSRNVQEGSSQIKKNVLELEKLAGGLQEIVGNFKL